MTGVQTCALPIYFDTMFSKVAFKYSALLGEYQEEAALVGITLMVIIPRLKSVEE